MKTLLKLVVAVLPLAFASASRAGEKAVIIVVGQPLSNEAQEVLAKFTKCGCEHEVHVGQDGKSSTRTSTRTYRSPITADFVQIVTVNEKVQRLYWQPAPSSEAEYWKTDFPEAAQISIASSTMRVTAESVKVQTEESLQSGAGQSATAPEPKPEGGNKPQTGAEARSK